MLVCRSDDVGVSNIDDMLLPKAILTSSFSALTRNVSLLPYRCKCWRAMIWICFLSDSTKSCVSSVRSWIVLFPLSFLPLGCGLESSSWPRTPESQPTPSGRILPSILTLRSSHTQWQYKRFISPQHFVQKYCCKSPSPPLPVFLLYRSWATVNYVFSALNLSLISSPHLVGRL